MNTTAPTPNADSSPTQTGASSPAAMSLAHAHDALCDAATRFHNEMLRQGTKEMSARQWAEEFRSWFSAYEFEKNYERRLSFLAEFDHEGT